MQLAANQPPVEMNEMANAFVGPTSRKRPEGPPPPAGVLGRWLSVQPDPLGDEARRAVGGGHGRQRQHRHRRPLHAGVGGRIGHRRRVAPPRELAGDEQVLQQGPRLHDGVQQPPLLRQRPLAGEHVEHGVSLAGRRGRRGGGGDGVGGGGDEAAVGVGDAGRDARGEELLQLVAGVVALLGHLADQVGELGDALLLPLQLLLGRLQLQRRRHEALLQLSHALLITKARGKG
jgi:hypothetical protein